MKNRKGQESEGEERYGCDLSQKQKEEKEKKKDRT